VSNGFGSELRRIRSERGLSLAQLARLIPCHRGYIAQLEKGVRRPSPEFTRKLDDVLGTDGLLAGLAQHGHQRPAAVSSADDELP
jgi:transcriptional regulator with XRE-family HTH domain